MTDKKLAELILDIAKIPSFTTYECRLHPYVLEFCEQVGAQTEVIGGSILATTAGKGTRTVALSAHLDKNNYWDDSSPREIFADTTENGAKLHGLLDDAVGMGVCLELLRQSASRKFPPLQMLFTECEESHGFRLHQHLLKDGGKNHNPGKGACLLSEHLIEKKMVPTAVVVVDVTPKFHGKKGIALYSRPWEKFDGDPAPELERQTDRIAEEFYRLCPRLKDYNNSNDYVRFGEKLNEGDAIVPCFALEPSVGNYHSCDEEVWVEDINETAGILTRFLESFAASNQ